MIDQVKPAILKGTAVRFLEFGHFETVIPVNLGPKGSGNCLTN